MWELDHKEGWALKNWCFWTVVFRVPWTARRSNQSILKEINPEYSLEKPVLKLKLQYFGHLMWRADSPEKTLMVYTSDGHRLPQSHMCVWFTPFHLPGITPFPLLSDNLPLPVSDHKLQLFWHLLPTHKLLVFLWWSAVFTNVYIFHIYILHICIYIYFLETNK